MWVLIKKDLNKAIVFGDTININYDDQKGQWTVEGTNIKYQSTEKPIITDDIQVVNDWIDDVEEDEACGDGIIGHCESCNHHIKNGEGHYSYDNGDVLACQTCGGDDKVYVHGTAI